MSGTNYTAMYAVLMIIGLLSLCSIPCLFLIKGLEKMYPELKLDESENKPAAVGLKARLKAASDKAAGDRAAREQ